MHKLTQGLVFFFSPYLLGMKPRIGWLFFLVKPSLNPPKISPTCPRIVGPSATFQRAGGRFPEKNARYPPGYPNILLMAEIRRSPVEVGSLSHYLRGFIHPRWLFGMSAINSIPPFTGKSENHRLKEALGGFGWMSRWK